MYILCTVEETEEDRDQAESIYSKRKSEARLSEFANKTDKG